MRGDMKFPARFHQKQKLGIVKDYKAGKPIKEIAEKYGVGLSTVSALATMLGINRRRHYRRFKRVDSIEESV